MSGRLWLKTASCAALAVAGASISPEAGVAAIFAGLCSGAAGNSFHELFGEGEDKLVELFGRTAIDPNHHVLLALRNAHIAALGVVVADAASDERSDVVAALRQYLEAANVGNKPGAGEITEFERTIFDGLSEGFDAVLAARSSKASDTRDAARARAAIENGVLAELAGVVGVDQSDLPARFVAIFRRHGDGWFDLFVRDAADRLKENEAFRAIWQSERLARIAGIVREISAQLDRIETTVTRTEGGVKDLAAATSRHHREMIAALERMSAEIAREKGVEPEKLWPILERLGHTKVPFAQIPDVLGKAVASLIARSERQTLVHNDGAAIDEAIRAARASLAEADVAEAISVIDAALAEDEAYALAVRAEEEATEHRKHMGRARARGFSELAFIQRTTFDHEGAIASLKAALDLDADRTLDWFTLGDEQILLGRLDDALRSFRDCLAIAESLAEADPGNAGWRRDLSVSYDKIGDVQVAQGRLDDALKSFRAGLAIAESLAEADPGNAQWRRDVIVSYVKLAEVDRDAAGAHLSKALEVAIELRDSGRLASRDSWMVDDLSARLTRAEAG